MRILHPGANTAYEHGLKHRSFKVKLTEYVESSFLIHQGGYHDLFVCL